jgi:hypothetical protein
LAWDYLQAVPGFVAIGTMLPRTSAFDYVFPLGVANHNAATGEMKIQFLHNAVTGVTSHYLHLDYVSFEKLGTSSALSGDVAAIRAQTDQLQFSSGSVKSDLQRILGTLLTETSGQIAAAFKKLFNVGTPLLVASDPMRGTDGAELSGAAATAVSGLAAAAGTDAAAKILTTPANKLSTDSAGRVDLVDSPNATAVLALKANVAATAAVAAVANVAATAAVAPTAAVAAVAGVANAADVVTAMEANGSKLDHLWEMTEDDAGTRQFTAHALLHTPAAQINLTDQEIANAVGNLAPVGAHAAGSLGANLDSILSTMALEATLAAMKGAGWTTETLVAIDVLLDAIKAKTDTITTALFTAVSGLVGDEVTIYHGATFDETVTGLTIPSDWVKLLFTLKANDADADVAALAQVQESNPGIAADGLIRINAAAPGAGENARAELIVSQAAGTVRIRLHQLATVALLPRSCRWDLKMITSDTIAEGTPLVVSSPAEIRYTTTRATG